MHNNFDITMYDKGIKFAVMSIIIASHNEELLTELQKELNDEVLQIRYACSVRNLDKALLAINKLEYLMLCVDYTMVKTGLLNSIGMLSSTFNDYYLIVMAENGIIINNNFLNFKTKAILEKNKMLLTNLKQHINKFLAMQNLHAKRVAFINSYNSLNNQQKNILSMLFNGCKTTEIAKNCKLSTRMVSKHKNAIQEKLQVKNLYEAHAKCIKTNLIDQLTN